LLSDHVFWRHCLWYTLTMSVEILLAKGPPGGDAAGGLDILRDAVLTNGIPSNSDGMVRR